MVGIHVSHEPDIVDTANVHDPVDPLKISAIISSVGDSARVIQLATRSDHGLRRPLPEFIGLDLMFFIANGPQNNTGMISIPLHKRCQLPESFRSRGSLPVLIHNQHTQPVAGV